MSELQTTTYRIELTDEQRAVLLAGGTVELFRPKEGERALVDLRDGVLVISGVPATEPEVRDE